MGRKKWTPQEKLDIVLAGLKNKSGITELCRSHGLSTPLYYQWRDAFLQGWITQPDALALGCLRGGKLSGYGVVRRCGEGYKVGPLFADDTQAAERLYARLAGFAEPGPVFLDVPENNPAAVELANRHRMKEVFGCARMYLGSAPTLAHERIFGVTTFELG